MGLPKACARLPAGDTFLSRLASMYREAGLGVVVVVGAHADAVKAAHPSLTFTLNDAWADGQFSSVRAGLREVTDRGAGLVAVHPVDAPSVAAATVQALANALGSARACVVPRHKGRSGHPVLLSREASLALEGDLDSPSLEAALRPFTPVYVDVEDGAVTDNFNAPADIL